MAGSKEQRPYAGKSDERKVSAVSNVQPQILSDSNQSVVAFRLPISTLQRLLTSMTRTRAHGLHRIPVLAPQEFCRHERPVCGELLTYAGMSDVALRCRPVECQQSAAQASELALSTHCCRSKNGKADGRVFRYAASGQRPPRIRSPNVRMHSPPWRRCALGRRALIKYFPRAIPVPRRSPTGALTSFDSGNGVLLSAVLYVTQLFLSDHARGRVAGGAAHITIK